MFYGNPYTQPYNSLVRVSGMDGAKAYQMPSNCTMALFDASEDIMYIKSTDGGGFPTIRTFRFEEVRPEPIKTDYVSRDEFEKLRKELMDYGKQFIHGSETGTTVSAAEHGEAVPQGEEHERRAGGQVTLPAERY